MGGLLPEFSQSVEKGLSTLSNGGRIIKKMTFNNTEKKILILKNFSGPIFELLVYNDSTIFKGLFYITSSIINIAKTSKAGNANFTFIVKNNNFYLQVGSNTNFVLLGISNIYAANEDKIALEESYDDLSSPNVTVTV